MQKASTGFVLFVRFPLWTAILVVIIMGVFGKRGWLDLKRMENQNRLVQEDISRAKDQQLALLKEIDSFGSDPLEQERVIRQVLGYIRPNETIIEFP